MDGFFNVYKPLGMTSFEVVDIIKRQFKVKAGHLGTLDPGATGVLPIAVNAATKAIRHIEQDDKEYVATLVLGIATDTQDRYGNIIDMKPVPDLSLNVIEDTLKRFKGEITQIPPMYSAKKVKGKKLYEMARSGLIVDREPIRVTIYDIILLDYEKPHLIKIKVRCSKGTYIRTLCQDIASSLNTCGHMVSLERVKAGVFESDESIAVDCIRAGDLLPIDYPFRSFKKVVVSGEDIKRVLNGGKINVGSCKDVGKVCIYSDKGTFLAVGLESSGFVKVLNVFASRG